jgi:hypothetical protein
MLPRMKTVLYIRTKGPPEARPEAKFCLPRRLRSSRTGQAL